MTKKNLLSKFFAVALLATVVFGATSCNRGYGCPYNVKLIQTVPAVLGLNQ